MDGQKPKTLLIAAGITVLLALALAALAGIDAAGQDAPREVGMGSMAGLLLSIAVSITALWTFFQARSVATADKEDFRPVAAPAPQPAVQPAPPPRPVAAAPSEPPGAEALMLLSLLQEKGRFVDFVMEDIAAYTNEQVGAAARVVHQGCRSVVLEAFEPRPVAPAENARITLEPGYDAEEFRLVGRAEGEPPFTVKVTHKGWRAAHVKLPRRLKPPAGADGRPAKPQENPIIVPAEVAA
jgi:hypothetical protein